MARTRAKPSLSLPSPIDLERICKGLAALDAIMSEDWESRYYSFDTAWNKKQKKQKERMASMRNGSGDDWFIVFTAAGTFVKAFWHEYEHEDADAIYEGLPAKLAAQRTEGAFMIDDGITFGGWHDGTAWTLRGNATPMKDELAILTGAAKHYRAYASAVHETKLPLDAIEHVLAGKPLTQAIVDKLSDERTLNGLKADLAEIGY